MSSENPVIEVYLTEEEKKELEDLTGLFKRDITIKINEKSLYLGELVIQTKTSLAVDKGFLIHKDYISVEIILAPSKNEQWISSPTKLTYNVTQENLLPTLINRHYLLSTKTGTQLVFDIQ